MSSGKLSWHVFAVTIIKHHYFSLIIHVAIMNLANNKKAHYCFMLLIDFWVQFLDFLLLLTVNQVMFNNNSIIVHLHYWILVSEVKAQLQMKTRNNIFWKLVPLICEKNKQNDLCKCKFVLKITKRISLLVIRRDCQKWLFGSKTSCPSCFEGIFFGATYELDLIKKHPGQPGAHSHRFPLFYGNRSDFS